MELEYNRARRLLEVRVFRKCTGHVVQPAQCLTVELGVFHLTIVWPCFGTWQAVVRTKLIYYNRGKTCDQYLIPYNARSFVPSSDVLHADGIIPLPRRQIHEFGIASMIRRYTLPFSDPSFVYRLSFAPAGKASAISSSPAECLYHSQGSQS